MKKNAATVRSIASLKKINSEDRTLTKVERLTESDRTKEIARMASGRDATDASIENAKEMIKNAMSNKRKIKNMRG